MQPMTQQDNELCLVQKLGGEAHFFKIKGVGREARYVIQIFKLRGHDEWGGKNHACR